MHVLTVSIRVKEGLTEAFLDVTRRNVTESLKEPGILRFDLFRDADSADRFLLVEVYRRVEDHSRHKQTPHYQRWVEEVEPMMAEPRLRSIYSSCFPRESGWEPG